jgi:hypothetical protein
MVRRVLVYLIYRLDALLRHLYQIREFTDDPNRVLRLAIKQAVTPLSLSDGTGIMPGDPVGELHLWNDHVPRFPSGGPTCQKKTLRGVLKPAAARKAAADMASRKTMRHARTVSSALKAAASRPATAWSASAKKAAATRERRPLSTLLAVLAERVHHRVTVSRVHIPA